MIIKSGKIIIDVRIDVRIENNDDLVKCIEQLQTRNAGITYRNTFRKIANDSCNPRGGKALYLIKFIPSIALLVAALADTLLHTLPGSPLLFVIAAAAYFYIFIILGDKKNYKTNFTELCTDKFLTDEIKQLNNCRGNVEKFLMERDKQLAEYFELEKEPAFTIPEPFDKLVTLDQDKIVAANPVSFDTDTNILEYKLYQDVEKCEIPTERIIETKISGREEYLYIDVLKGIAMHCM